MAAYINSIEVNINTAVADGIVIINAGLNADIATAPNAYLRTALEDELAETVPDLQNGKWSAGQLNLQNLLS